MGNPKETKLDKNEFLTFLDKKELFSGFELVNKFGERRISMNPGVPAMLLRSISQFAGKSMENLITKDAFNMHRVINNVFDGEIDYFKIKKFRKQHNLSFFGMSQYTLLDYYHDMCHLD